MDNEKFRKFEKLVDLYVLTITQELAAARNRLDAHGQSEIMNQLVDEILANLEMLDLRVAEARRKFGPMGDDRSFRRRLTDNLERAVPGNDNSSGEDER